MIPFVMPFEQAFFRKSRSLNDFKSEHLHDFTTFNSDVSVNVMATQMNLLGKLAGGDLVALEAKHHFTCLTKYRNQYRSHIRSDTS